MKTTLRGVLIWVGLFLLLAACNPAASQASGSATLVYATAHPQPSVTPTPFLPYLPVSFLQPSTPTPFLPQTPIPTATPTTTPIPPPVFNPNDFLLTPSTPPAFFQPEGVPTAFPLLGDNETVNFILLGSDRRGTGSYRTDTMVVVILRPANGEVTLISIPRDLYVYIPGVGMQRINTAYLFGDVNRYPGRGPGLLKDTILYNLGIRIDHTAMVDFNGFRRIVDTLGGVDVPVTCPYTDWRLIHPDLNPNNANNWELHTVSPGIVHMDGEYALWYARARKRSSDFDRGRRQQELLRAIFVRGTKTDIFTRLPQLYDDFNSTIATDLGLEDILKIAPLVVRLHYADIRSYYIRRPMVSAWTTPQGAYVLIPDGEKIQSMLVEALAPAIRSPLEESVIVEIQNGTTIAGLDRLASERLNYAGYQTRILPQEDHSVARTLLFDLTDVQDRERANSILGILGLSGSSLFPAPLGNYPAAYRLLLGNDYQPCFNP